MNTPDWTKMIETEGAARAVVVAFETRKASGTTMNDYVEERGPHAEAAAADLTRTLQSLAVLRLIAFPSALATASGADPLVEILAPKQTSGASAPAAHLTPA